MIGAGCIFLRYLVNLILDNKSIVITEIPISRVSETSDLNCSSRSGLKSFAIVSGGKNISLTLSCLDFKYEDKKFCVLANWPVFGKSLAHVLTCKGAKVVVAGASETDLADKTAEADVLITALGKPKFIKKQMVKKDAVVIDIGITKADIPPYPPYQGGSKVYGDVDFLDVKDKVGFIVAGRIDGRSVALPRNTYGHPVPG